MLNIDADPRNADWIKVVGRARDFEEWSAQRIDSECRDAYAKYLRGVRARHIAYFDARPDEQSATHSFAASSREAAFPPGWSHLADAIGDLAWHRYHLSGGSSQTLAIALLSAAWKADPTLGWLPCGDTVGMPATSSFEVKLAPEILNERPRQTSLDWLVEGATGVLVAEAKFTEQGFGTCSCESKASGRCASRVLERPYWSVASQALGLQRRDGSSTCSLSLAYQPVRNIAAAAALAGPTRSATFVLLYDARNPYFAGAGAWPGWVVTLASLAAYSHVPFAALSWQELLVCVDLGPDVGEWAREKHGFA